MYATSNASVIIVAAAIALVSAGGCGYGLRPVCEDAHFDGMPSSSDPATASDGGALVWYDPEDEWPGTPSGATIDPSTNVSSKEGADWRGCYACRLVCSVDAPSGTMYRAATAWSGASYGDACGVAEQALAHWAHVGELRLLAACARETPSPTD
jgi:hypothetical protein